VPRRTDPDQQPPPPVRPPVPVRPPPPRPPAPPELPGPAATPPAELVLVPSPALPAPAPPERPDIGVPPEPLPPWRQQLAELRQQLADGGWMGASSLLGTGRLNELFDQGWMSISGGPGPAALAQEALVREAGKVVDVEVQRRLRERLAGQPGAASLRAQRNQLRQEAARIADDFVTRRTPVVDRLLWERFGGRLEAGLSIRERERLDQLALQDPDVGPALRADAERLVASLDRRIAVEEAIAEAEARETRASRTVLLEVLAEERPMGAAVEGQAWRFVDRPGQASDPQVQAMLEQGARFWPRRWIERSNQLGGIHAARAQRGSHLHYPDGSCDIAVSGRGGSKLPEDSPGLPVAIHEEGHRMERAVEGLSGFEWAFYRRRTAPRGGHPSRAQTRAQGLAKLTPGQGYGPDELVRKDRFANPYVGKDYDNGRGGQPNSSYEVFSTGSEGLWTGSHDLDSDHRRFVLGLLTLLPGEPP
jgi:hypothetical protein